MGRASAQVAGSFFGDLIAADGQPAQRAVALERASQVCHALRHLLITVVVVVVVSVKCRAVREELFDLQGSS